MMINEKPQGNIAPYLTRTGSFDYTTYYKFPD